MRAQAAGAGEPWEAASPPLPAGLHSANPLNHCVASERSTPLGASASLTYSVSGTAVLPEPSSRDNCLSTCRGQPRGTAGTGSPGSPAGAQHGLTRVVGPRLCAGVKGHPIPKEFSRHPPWKGDEKNYIGLALSMCQAPCYALAETLSLCVLRTAPGLRELRTRPREHREQPIRGSVLFLPPQAASRPCTLSVKEPRVCKP